MIKMKNNKVEILLVEDNLDDLKIILYAFEKYEINELCKINIVHDGVEALQYIFGDSGEESNVLAHYPMLILLDLNIPKIHGLEVLKKVKSHKVAKKIHVAVLTASDKKTDWLDAHSFGADSYIQKSCDYRQYIDAANWTILSAINEKKFRCQ